MRLYFTPDCDVHSGQLLYVFVPAGYRLYSSSATQAAGSMAMRWRSMPANGGENQPPSIFAFGYMRKTERPVMRGGVANAVFESPRSNREYSEGMPDRSSAQPRRLRRSAADEG